MNPNEDNLIYPESFVTIRLIRDSAPPPHAETLRLSEVLHLPRRHEVVGEAWHPLPGNPHPRDVTIRRRAEIHAQGPGWNHEAFQHFRHGLPCLEVEGRT